MEEKQEYQYQPIVPGNEYYNLERRSEIREGARKLRRQYLRYKEAEIIYSMSHKKLLELAGKAGAIVRIDATVLIDREVFDRYPVNASVPKTLVRFVCSAYAAMCSSEELRKNSGVNLRYACHTGTYAEP